MAKFFYRIQSPVQLRTWEKRKCSCVGFNSLLIMRTDLRSCLDYPHDSKKKVSSAALRGNKEEWISIKATNMEIISKLRHQVTHGWNERKSLSEMVLN
jgi:hypothetical protein